MHIYSYVKVLCYIFFRLKKCGCPSFARRNGSRLGSIYLPVATV